MAGPFYFAWVNPTDDTWNDSFKRWDEDIFSADVEHAEGDCATLTLEIKNPRVGLLNPGRLVWAWFSWTDPGGTHHPLFFGRLIGIPSNMFAEVISIVLVAKPEDFVKQKQNLAESLKVPPFYDPIFLSLDKRDDPDAILEGYGSLYHVTRVGPLSYSVSDPLIGEGGTETFNANDSFYDSVEVKLNQPPLVAVGVQMSVKWTQAWRGEINVDPVIYNSYQKNLIGKWPQPLSSLGGGWSISYSLAGENPLSANQGEQQFNWTWTNHEKTHNDGDIMSITITSDIGSNPVGGKVTFMQIGLVDPFAVDIEGNPDPKNIPAITTVSKPVISSQTRFGGLVVLRYEAKRERTERAFFTLQSDVQPVITDPTFTQDTEQITLDGGDVSLPILDLLNWTSVASSFVGLGTLVFPDDPTLPGQTSTQICSTAGTTGADEPVFSQIAGDTTVDGSAVWTSLGNTQPAESAPDWTQYTQMPLGAVILPRVPIATPYAWLQLQGLIQNPPTGFSAGLGQYVIGLNGYAHVCTKGGQTGAGAVAWATSHGATVFDNEVIWTCVGANLAPGDTYFLATVSGTTAQVIPDFFSAATLGDTISDGDVTWTCIGGADLPIGGYPGYTPRRSYFPTDRGLRSLRYGILRARARLRLRSRAVEVTFGCHYGRAIQLNCHKNAVLFDPRLPGGTAGGKIIRYGFKADGDRAQLIGSVTIGCSVGNANALVVTEGTAVYVDGVFEAGEVQQWIGRIEAIDATVGFGRPLDQPYDDGLTFPLSQTDAVIESSFNGASTAPLTTAVNEALALSLDQASIPPGADATGVIVAYETMNTNLKNNLESALAQFPVWYRLVLKPVDTGPFQGAYNIPVTQLMIPKTIDLEAS